MKEPFIFEDLLKVLKKIKLKKFRPHIAIYDDHIEVWLKDVAYYVEHVGPEAELFREMIDNSEGKVIGGSFYLSKKSKKKKDVRTIWL
jgi:hypothetical protein